ncbi:MAG: hypothetical protein AAF675_19350, partial [Pseudomonadota bacterium]
MAGETVRQVLERQTEGENAQQEQVTGDRGLGSAPIGFAPASIKPRVPPQPSTLEDLGLETNMLIGLLMKALYRLGHEQSSEMSETLRIPMALTNQLVEMAIELKL